MTDPTSPEAVDLSNLTLAEALGRSGVQGSTEDLTSKATGLAVSGGVDDLMSFTINNVEQSKPVPVHNTHKMLGTR